MRGHAQLLAIRAPSCTACAIDRRGVIDVDVDGASLLNAAMRIAFVLVLAACSSPSNPSSVDGQPVTPPGVDAADPTTMPDALAASDAPAAPSTCVGRTAQPVDATWTLTVGGKVRTSLVHVPASYDPTKAMPVVIDLHGLGGDGAQEAALTSANANADSAGFISVHPTGATTPIGSWNAGQCCGTAPSEHVDDMGFLTALLDELDAKLCVDDARVYAMGISNGGYMSHRLACELADRFAAIGPVAGGIAVSSCQPSRPVPVFAVHGNADQLVSYSFGQSSASFWAMHNGCTTTTTTFHNGTATCVTHGGCSAGADVVWCTIDQGGHQWPGGQTIPFLGNNTNDLIATDAIWAFFVAHPRP